jgi:TetR/AcrR family transcriptional repressor of lmrAB and yxaGH operons
MGAKGEETRTRLLQATRLLIEAQGYYGTGLNQVLAESRAPRGSLYFHFPEGKDELVALSLQEAGQGVTDLIAGITGGELTPVEAVRGLLEIFAERMTESDYAKGCPLATVALETAAGHERLRRVCADAYETWQQSLARMLLRHGRDAAAAESLAGALLSLVEGALLLARVQHSRVPLDQAARAAEILLRD